MAVTVTAVSGGTYSKEWTVTMDADTDASATITHGLGGVPLVILIPNTSDGLKTAYLSAKDATTVTIGKSTATGSAPVNARVLCYLHSLIR